MSFWHIAHAVQHSLRICSTSESELGVVHKFHFAQCNAGHPKRLDGSLEYTSLSLSLSPKRWNQSEPWYWEMETKGKEIEMERGGEQASSAQTEEEGQRPSRNEERRIWSPIPKKQRIIPQQEQEQELEEEEEGEDEARASESNVNNGDGGDRSISFALTDPGLLDCPVCAQNLTIPVFQCRNGGHLACSSCCVKLGNKCPCSSPFGEGRCQAVEKIVESVKTSCRNREYGCTETVIFCKKHDHEEMCIYGPCSCPLPDCDFIDSSKNLFLHFSTKHSESAKSFKYGEHFSIALDVQQEYLILQEEKGGTIFVLNNWVEYLGNVINVSCIAPSASKLEFCYDLTARSTGSSVYTKLLSFTEFVPAWVVLEHCNLKRFLVVPRDFVGSDGHLKLELCIWEP